MVNPTRGAEKDKKRSPDRRISPKSDAGLAFYAAHMPHYEIHLMDGSIVTVPYKELDERLAEFKRTRKERRRAQC